VGKKGDSELIETPISKEDPKTPTKLITVTNVEYG